MQEPPSRPRPARRALLVLTLLHVVAFAALWATEFRRADGMVVRNAGSEVGAPVGADFINLWTAGRLVLDGQTDAIYQPAEFMAAEERLADSPLGFHVWAYPPPSLFIAVPFGALPYYPALACWSALGLAALAYGAHRIGLGRTGALLVTFSPASMLCVYYGQTGNLAAGLLLAAFAARSGRTAAGPAAVLTIKPQMGFLLPLVWALQRRWQPIVASAVAALAFGAASLVVFGSGVWDGYLHDTVPALAQFEKTGTGPFTYMIPSLFMAARIVTGDGDLALQIHVAVAAVLTIAAAVAMARSRSERRTQVIALVATALLTPYLHIYDLAFVAAAGLLLAQLWERSDSAELPTFAYAALPMAWLLPYLTAAANVSGWPFAPLLLAGLGLLAWRTRHIAEPAQADAALAATSPQPALAARTPDTMSPPT